MSFKSAAANRRYAFQFVSHWYYSIISFGGRALPAPVAGRWLNNQLMKSLCDCRCFVALSSLILLGGCMRPMGPDVAVVDLSTGEVRHPNYTSRRQIVVSVDSSNQLFRTMVRADDHLSIRTLNRDCVQTDEVTIPLFSESVCSRQGRALSPEGDRFVYYKGGTLDLCLYDLKTRRESAIWTNIAHYEMHVPKVEWLSDSELLIVRQEDGFGSTNEIVVFDLVRGAKRRLVTAVDLSSFDYSLSPDRRLLAYWEGRAKHSIYGHLKVLDLKTGSVVATLGSGEDELLGHPSWSFDGRLLAYVEGDRIMVFTLETKQSKSAAVLDGDTVTYNLLMGQDVVVHFGEKQRGAISHTRLPLMIIDWRTGHSLKRKGIDVTGEMYFLEKDRCIVCEIGY